MARTLLKYILATSCVFCALNICKGCIFALPSESPLRSFFLLIQPESSVKSQWQRYGVSLEIRRRIIESSVIFHESLHWEIYFLIVCHSEILGATRKWQKKVLRMWWTDKNFNLPSLANEVVKKVSDDFSWSLIIPLLLLHIQINLRSRSVRKINIFPRRYHITSSDISSAFSPKKTRIEQNFKFSLWNHQMLKILSDSSFDGFSKWLLFAFLRSLWLENWKMCMGTFRKIHLIWHKSN